MKARIAFMSLAICWAFSTISPASTPPALNSPPLESSGEGPQFIIDYSSFRGYGSQTFTEFYIQVPFDDLQFIKSESGFKAAYRLQVEILNHIGEWVNGQIVEDSIEVDSFMETVATEKARVCQMGFNLEPASYRIEASLLDKETLISNEVGSDFVARDFNSTSLQVSDLQFSSEIIAASDENVFVKNGRRITPTPSKIFASDISSDMFIYFEIYNLAFGGDVNEQSYTAVYTFHDSEGHLIAKLKRENTKPGETAAHSLKFPLRHFKPDSYSIRVEISDNTSNESHEARGEFVVFGSPAMYSQVSFE